MSYVVRSAIAVFAAFFPFAAFPTPAHAEVSHTVTRGHTIEAIAHRYKVTAKAIVDANHLKDPKHLKIGETLIIPGVFPPPPAPPPAPVLAVKAGVPVNAANAANPVNPSAASAASAKGALSRATHGAKAKDLSVVLKAVAKPVRYDMRAKTPGVVHATRLATSEDFTIRVNSRRGRQTPTASGTFEKMLRSSGNLAHPIDPRLIALVGIVSNHFGSRKLEIVSGFRPFTPTQHTAHSNHNVGKAMDFRVAGVPNEVLRDYCKTLHNVGVGYYPNSTFVHLDVRATPAFWIDFSKPGEAPRYNSPNVEADEGTSDVAEEPHTPAEPASSSALPFGAPARSAGATLAPTLDGAAAVASTPSTPSAEPRAPAAVPGDGSLLTPKAEPSESP